MKTRLESESFEILIDFPEFLLQKLWPKKQNNYRINTTLHQVYIAVRNKTDRIARDFVWA